MTAPDSQSPPLEEQRDFYNRRWSAQAYVGKAAAKRAAAMLDLLWRTGLKQPEILDLGCGTGWFAATLSNFGKVTALDLSDESVGTARERWPWIEFHAGNALEASFEGRQFDVVVSQEVIEHIEDQGRYLTQIASLLKVGGYCILTTPNEFAMRSMPPRTRRRWRDQPIEKRLTKRSLLQLVRRRFDVVVFRSVLLDYSTRGAYRLIRARPLRVALKTLGLEGLWISAWEKLGYGLHFTLLLRKK